MLRFTTHEDNDEHFERPPQALEVWICNTILRHMNDENRSKGNLHILWNIVITKSNLNL